MDVSTRVKNLIAEQFFGDPPEMLDTMEIVNDLGADSLDVVELVMDAEFEFDIEIEDDDVVKVVTVGDAVALVKRLVKP
jgi:acyl carrier protein